VQIVGDELSVMDVRPWTRADERRTEPLRGIVIHMIHTHAGTDRVMCCVRL